MNISSASAQTSPLQRLLTTTSSASSSGTISATDATAIASAATDIDASLKAGSSTAASGSSGARASRPPSPDEMKSKIDGFIDAQVTSGTLTTSQASELKDAFAKSAPGVGSAGGSGGGRPGGVGGPGGPPPGPPPSGASSDDDDPTSDSSSNASSGSTTSTIDLLQSFVEALRSVSANGANYGATGTAASPPSSATLLDFQT